jgi:hypothetical protein
LSGVQVETYCVALELPARAALSMIFTASTWRVLSTVLDMMFLSH